MFGKKKKEGAPVKIDGHLSRRIGSEWGKIAMPGDHWVNYLAVKRPRSENKDIVDVRIFDEFKANEKKVKVLDYASLDSHPDLVLLEGWLDDKSKKTDIKAKKAA
ncbi:MAG: hypothetical protein KKE57_07030 [Proteobacteria bacterium]|nr:hypothetical protein [Pseudomonadota bacterium]